MLIPEAPYGRVKEFTPSSFKNSFWLLTLLDTFNWLSWCIAVDSLSVLIYRDLIQSWESNNYSQLKIETWSISRVVKWVWGFLCTKIFSISMFIILVSQFVGQKNPVNPGALSSRSTTLCLLGFFLWFTGGWQN